VDVAVGQVSAPAANANLFVIYLGEFFPRAKDLWPRAIILALLVGLLTFINIRGVRGGTRVSNFFTAAKLVPLFAVILLGLYLLQSRHWTVATTPVAANTGQWLKAMLLLVFAYGGFETALAPMSEAKESATLPLRFSWPCCSALGLTRSFNMLSSEFCRMPPTARAHWRTWHGSRTVRSAQAWAYPITARTPAHDASFPSSFEFRGEPDPHQ
jgi:Amino acid permease